MQNYDDVIPEEGAEQNQPLVQNLRRFYQTNDADAQSHARMRERLLASGEQNEVLAKTSLEREKLGIMLHNYNNSNGDSKAHGEVVIWQRSLSMIAAVVFVALLVGSLVVVLDHARQSATGNNKPAVSTTWPGRQSSLIGIHMFDAITGWAEGTDGTVLRTTDGGIHWKDVTPPKMSHTTLWSGRNQYISATTVWIAVTVNKDNSLYYRPSTTSLIFHTTNGGQTWQESTLNTGGYQVDEITFANSQDGWLLTKYEQGIHQVTGPETTPPPDLFHTTNGGKTWAKVLNRNSSQAQLFSNVVITGFSFGNQTTGLLTGMKGSTPYTYITNDGGLTWQLMVWVIDKNVSPSLQPSGVGIPYFFTSMDAELPFFFNQNSDFALYITHNGGVSWTISPFLHLASDPAKGIYGFGQSPLFINTHDGWVEGFDGSHGVLYATIDGGQHWTKVTPKSGTITVNGLPNFTTPEVGWVLDYAFNTHTGNQITVLYGTTDGGHTWKQVHAIFPDFIVPKSAFTH